MLLNAVLVYLEYLGRLILGCAEKILYVRLF